MLVTMIIPDELYEKYKAMDPKDPRRGILKQLDRMQNNTPYQRSLVLQRDHVKALDEALGGHTGTPEELVAAVQKMTAISIDGTNVSLTSGQLKRMASLAAFYKREPSDFLKDHVSRSFRATWGV